MAPRLKVSDNQRFLTYEDGRPFFWLGDTAWELFHALNLEQADQYLRNRAERHFTVIQAVVLAEMDGLHTPNAYGHLALVGDDPTKPNEEYFKHVDWVVTRAEELGLWIGMLPTWGDKWSNKWGRGPQVFTPENARVYGEFLGRRYRHRPILWVLGGDRPVESDTQLAVLRAMAEGLDAGDGGEHLMTLHPCGGRSSSEFVHHEPWLDCNMLQSGHAGRDIANYDMLARDYNLTPVKPTLDGEPCYEDHPIMSPNWSYDPANGYFDEYSVRKAAYWALFAGAHGHTYGCHPVWMMYDGKRPKINNERRPWQEAIELPGAAQMQHARALMESRPFVTRVPDQALLASPAGRGPDHVQATRDIDGTYAFVYVPSGKPVSVNMAKLSGKRAVARWFDPRTGKSTRIDELATAGTKQFRPPSGGPDWVLVLDDKARKYGPPGTPLKQ